MTLKFDNAPAREVYDALAKQAGAPFKTLRGDQFWERQNDKPVKINLDKAPFWKAMDELEQQTDLALKDWGSEMVLDTAEAGRGHGPVFTDGPFKVVAVGMGMPGRYHQLKVFVEPKLRILAYAIEADIEEATDAQGQAVAARPRLARGGGPDMHPRGGNAFDVRLPIDMMPRQIAHLKGSVRARLVVREDTVEIDDMAKANNVDQVIDGRRFMVNLMTPEPGEHLVTLIAFDMPVAPGGAHVKPRLVDDDGKEFNTGGRSSGSNGKRHDYHFTFRAAPGCGKPSKLILSFPAATRDIKIPFEFGHEER